MRLKEVYIEVGDDEYGITPTDYSPGEEPCRCGHPDNWDAGSGPEMDFPERVTYYANGAVGNEGVEVPWETMVLGYGADNHLSYSSAEEAIRAKCYEAYEDFPEDDYDDGDYDDWRDDDYDWEGE